MGTLSFFPWLHLSDPIRVSGFELIPYRRGMTPAGAGTPDQAVLDALLDPYRHAPQGRVGSATLLRFDGRALLEDLQDDEADQVLRFGELVAFAGLAARRFFEDFRYSNRDHYRLIVQQFTDPSSGLGVVSRRRDGAARTIVTRSAVLVLKPYHVSTTPTHDVDVPLLESLLRRATTEDWGEIEDAITGFNAASTDSPDVREDTEAVTILGALERLFGLRGGNEHELANAFVSAIVPTTTMSPLDCARITGSARRESFDKYGSLREVWIRDFFRLRGDHAHGKIAPQYRSLWALREHLLLVSFAFPLVAKARLVRDGVYTWTDQDLAAVESFERLVCMKHFEVRDDDHDDDDDDEVPSTWPQVLNRAETRRSLERWLASRETVPLADTQVADDPTGIADDDPPE